MTGLLLAAGLVLASAAAAANVSRAQADAFQVKLQRIVQQSGAETAAGRSTVVTEGEVNSYLHYQAGEHLPVGVTNPSVAIHPQGRLGGRAVVDLDRVREKKSSGGWFDPLSYLTGRVPVSAIGTLRTYDGVGRFELESAEVGGIPVPKAFLQELVSFYTRSDEHPRGLSLDQPFDLPAGIRGIDTHAGRATIVQ